MVLNACGRKLRQTCSGDGVGKGESVGLTGPEEVEEGNNRADGRYCSNLEASARTVSEVGGWYLVLLLGCFISLSDLSGGALRMVQRRFPFLSLAVCRCEERSSVWFLFCGGGGGGGRLSHRFRFSNRCGDSTCFILSVLCSGDLMGDTDRNGLLNTSPGS